MAEQALIGPRVFAQDRTYECGYVVFSDGRINEVGPARRAIDLDGDRVLRLPPQYTVVPGRIDLHVHGAGGADTMDATPDALRTIAETLPREGTTSFLATTITAPVDGIEAALRNAGEYIEIHERSKTHRPPGAAEVLGIHLEGPFISTRMVGAHPTEHVVEPDSELFERWQTTSGGTIEIVVLAPEIDGALETATALSRAGVVASIGHSNATYDETNEAIEAGFSHVTHLFNGMRGLHHREPGVVGAALLRDEVTTELIADGIHVRPEVVRLAYETVGPDRLILITDSMRAKGIGSGTHDLGERPVSVAGGEARLPNGTLAGSVLRMDRAIENVMAYTGCSMREAIGMSAENPAKRLGLFDRKGGLRAGKDADLVVLDGDDEVVLTLCRGAVAYRSEMLDPISWS